MLKFFEYDGDRVVFSGDILKIYLPKNYFESKIAEYNGDIINTIGFFFFEVKSNEMDDKDQDGKFYTLKLPAKIDFEFNYIIMYTTFYITRFIFCVYIIINFWLSQIKIIEEIRDK